MQFMLMDYVQAAGFDTLTRAEQEHWLAVCKAYMEPKPKCRRAEEQWRTAAHVSGDNCPER